MSAYSFVNHRMFVAALNNDAGTQRPVEPFDSNPTHAVDEGSRDSFQRPRSASAPMAGVLLANAMLNGYQPAAS